MSFKSKKTDLPPGTIKISDNFYADKTEITNIGWREYMYWSKRVYGENSNEYKLIIPDTTVWDKEGLTGIKLDYLRNPKYNNYPIVGITYEQAVKYCKWRSDRVNELVWIKKTGEKHDFIKNFDYKYEDLPKMFEYRLPTKEEWIKISTNENIKSVNNETEHLTYPISNSKIDAFYELNNNVSEMTSEQGVSMGGNWKTSDNYDESKYDGASNILGFRCVCVRKIK